MSTIKVTTATPARRGGFRKHAASDPDNVLGKLGVGEYEVHYQCAGQEIRQPAIGHSYWWVCVTTPWGRAFVTALHVEGGNSDDPVSDVAVRKTFFEAPETHNGPFVKVIRETELRTAGTTVGTPDTFIGQDLLPAGSYRAMAQCAGEQIDNGVNRNFWWVYLRGSWAVGDPVSGWVNAVDIATGDDDGPIPAHGLPKLPTVFKADIAAG